MNDAATAEKRITLPDKIIVRDFAVKLERPVTAVIAELIKNGVMATQNEEIDFDTAAIIAEGLGVVAERAGEERAEAAATIQETILRESVGTLVPRPPVVVVLGHVDHGKTLLLDAIRETHVAKGEAGGITQHIGAYQVTVPTKERSSQRESTGKGIPDQVRDDGANRTVTFIDTPGHEAFAAMRSRGARVADVAILVVAADDGIQPQTKEAIAIMEQAKLPFVVAINKIDKPDANPERVKKELAEMNLLPEDWGGKTITVPVSAKAGKGIPELLEMVLLVADVEKDTIKADPSASPIGTVIEAHIDKGEGPVATVLVHSGTLRPGQTVSVGTAYGKIRSLKDFRSKSVREAPPSMPVRILGLKAAPAVGDLLRAATGELQSLRKELRKTQYTQKRKADQTERGEELTDDPTRKTVNLVLKADTLGSLEAIHAALKELRHPEVRAVIIDEGLGNITEADVLRAETSGALLRGFNVTISRSAEEVAKGKHITIQTYRVIYELLDEVHGELEKLLTPEVVERDIGTLKILAIFRSDKASMIVGGRVQDGSMVHGATVKVVRDGKEVGHGQITQLQSQKQTVKEVPRGQECGIKYHGEPVIAVGDLLVAVEREERAKKLEHV